MKDVEISRRIFFWTLVIIFWLVSGIIIGYTFGYRFSFERGVFVYAGSITIKTTPQKSEVYINGSAIPSASFNVLNGSQHIGSITPGEYFLEVKYPGYQTWSKKISVHSGISTEFWNIVLAENSYERENYSSPRIEKFFISPRKNLAAFFEQNGNEFLVKITDPKKIETDQIFSSIDYVFTNDEKENIEWSPQAHSIIIPALKDGERNYFIVNIETKKSLDLKTLAQSGNISHVRWDPKNKDVLYYMSESNLYRMDLNAPQDKKLIAEHIASYDLSPKALFYFQLPGGIVYKINFDASDAPQQITTSAPENMSDSSYQIIVYDDYRIVFLNNNNHYLYIYNEGDEDSYFQKLSEDAQGSQFSDDGKKLLYWSEHEILTYFVRKWEVQPKRSENENMSITRLSDSIKNVQWTIDYEHVLFTIGNKLKMIEIDNRDNRNMMDITTIDNNDPMIVDNFSDGKVYFTEKNGEGQNELRSINFPEKTTFLQGLFPETTNNTTIK